MLECLWRNEVAGWGITLTEICRVAKKSSFIRVYNKLVDSVEDLKKEIVGLKTRIRRLENFVRSMPNSDDYVDESIDNDSLFENAVDIIKQHSEASASLLQRRLSIGYSRAARILDQLEEKGYLEPAEGSKPRKVIKK